MSVKLLTEHDWEFISLTGGCTGSSESIDVKMPHCWELRVKVQLYQCCLNKLFVDCLKEVRLSRILE